MADVHDAERWRIFKQGGTWMVCQGPVWKASYGRFEDAIGYACYGKLVPDWMFTQ